MSGYKEPHVLPVQQEGSPDGVSDAARRQRLEDYSGSTVLSSTTLSGMSDFAISTSLQKSLLFGFLPFHSPTQFLCFPRWFLSLGISGFTSGFVSKQNEWETWIF